MEVNSSQILLVDVTFYFNIFKFGTWCANKKWKSEYMRQRRLKGWNMYFIHCWFNYRVINSMIELINIQNCWYLNSVFVVSLYI